MIGYFLNCLLHSLMHTTLQQQQQQQQQQEKTFDLKLWPYDLGGRDQQIVCNKLSYSPHTWSIYFDHCDKRSWKRFLTDAFLGDSDASLPLMAVMMINVLIIVVTDLNYLQSFLLISLVVSELCLRQECGQKDGHTDGQSGNYMISLLLEIKHIYSKVPYTWATQTRVCRRWRWWWWGRSVVPPVPDSSLPSPSSTPSADTDNMSYCKFILFCLDI